MPLLWLSLAFLCGILFSAQLSLSPASWLLIAGLSLGLLILRPLLKRKYQHLPIINTNITNHLLSFTHHFRLPLPFLALTTVLLFGAYRFAISLPNLSDPTFIAYYNDTDAPLILEGVLVKPPDVRDRYTNLSINVDQLSTSLGSESIPIHGLALARTFNAGDWHYGERIRLQGAQVTPPSFEDFSYRDYLARQGVYAYLPDAQVDLLESNQGNPVLAAIYTLKAHFLEMVYQLYPDPEASLLAGILLGVESGIPQPVRQAFNDTGTAHIIVISGFNITILAGLFSTIFSRLLGRWRGAITATLGIGLYTLLVGADAAVVRAALMGGLAVFARQVGRRQNGMNSLTFVAALMALFNPKVLWDVGFQLSFAATLGLVLYAEPFTNAFVRFASRLVPPGTAQRLAGPFGEYLLFTLAAQLTTLPIILYYFRRLSLISLLANPVILPVQPPVMVLGGLGVLLGELYLPLGQAIAYLAWPFVSFTIRAVEFFAHFQGRALTLGSISLPVLIGFYALLFLVTFNSASFKKYLPALKPSLVFLLLGAVTITIWRAAMTAPDGKLHLFLLETNSGASSGEALLVQTPGGRFVLIDGGPSPSALSDALGRRLPMQQRSLDWLVVAGSKDNQLAALPNVMERYPPANVLWAAPLSESSSARYLQEDLAQAGIPLSMAQAGQSLNLGNGARLQVLAVDDYGATLLLSWDNFRALLPLGLDAHTLEKLQTNPNLSQVSAYLLADRGRDWLNPPEWIDKIHPQVVLLNVAAGDWDGFPPAETLQALQGYTLVRTDRNGWVHLSTDGKQMWVEAER
jgi:competence protein ComEC